jgi:hypothetical protein
MTELGTAADAHRLSRTKSQFSRLGQSCVWPCADQQRQNHERLSDDIGREYRLFSFAEDAGAKPTGGALGNVTVPELEMLRSSEAPIDPQIDPEAFRTSLATIMDNRKRVLFKIPGGREAYREWRKRWLGYDPYVPKNKRGKASGSKPKGGGSWSITEVE